MVTTVLASLCPTSADPADRVAFGRYEPNRIDLDVGTGASGALALSETYDPGWRADVDGRRTPVLVAYNSLRAVAIPAGAHAVSPRYEPRSLPLGLAVTLATAGLAALLWGGPGWIARRQRGVAMLHAPAPDGSAGRAQAEPAPGRRRRARRRRRPSSPLSRVVARPTPLVARPFRTRWRSDNLGVLALLALVGAALWDRLRLERDIARVDLLTFFLPWHAHLGERLRAFDVPGWNPHVFAGVPFAGDPESGWMYLPAMLLFAALPPILAIKGLVAFHLVLAALSAYALARVLGMGPPAALVAGTAYLFSPFLEYTRCCTVFSVVAAWLPLALLGVELAARSRDRLARAGWWGVAGLAVSQMLGGWIGQGAYYGLLAVGGWTVYRTLLTPPRPTPPRARAGNLALHGAAVLLLGLGLAASGVLPRVEAVGRSQLAGGSYEGVGQASEGVPGLPLSALVDRVLGTDRQGRYYLGGATFALAVLAPVLSRRRFPVRWLVAYAIGVLALVGPQTPLHGAVYRLLPRFETLHSHAPHRALTVLWIAPALLAGASVAALDRWARRPAALAGFAALPLIALGAVAAWLRRDGLEPDPQPRLAAFRVGLVLLAAAGLGAATARRRTRDRVWARWVVASLLVAVLFRDLTEDWWNRYYRVEGPRQTVARHADAGGGGAGAFLRARQAEEPVRYFGYDAAFLQDQPDGRRGSYHGYFREAGAQAVLAGNRALYLGLQEIQGYNPVQVQRYVDLLDALNGQTQNYHDGYVRPTGLDSPLLDLLNARYIVVPAAVPPGRPDLLHLGQRHPTVYRDDRVRVLERTTALPRAWVVHEARQVARGEALDLLVMRAVDPRRVALLEDEPPPLGPSAASDADRVAFERYEPDRLTLTALAGAPGMLVLGEIYDPGWRAYVDGERVELYVADHALRAVALPAGEHRVEFRYEPWSLRLGLAVTLAAAAVLVGVWLGLAGRRVRVGAMGRSGSGRMETRKGSRKRSAPGRHGRSGGTARGAPRRVVSPPRALPEAGRVPP